MTAPPLESPPVASPRPELELLLSFAVGDLLAEWASGTAEQVRDALAATMQSLAGFYGPAAATLGADWYDDARAAARVPGRFRAIAAEMPTDERFESLAGWGTGPLFQAEPDVAAAQALVKGGFQRVVADAHRDTVIGSLAADPQAAGWRRQIVDGTCDFCTRIAARGAVYSARTAAFSAHDDCDCLALPQWGQGVKVLPYVPSQRFRTQTSRDRNNARTRAWLNAT